MAETQRLIRRAIDGLYLRQLPIVTLVIGCYYAFLTLAHYFVLPPDLKPTLMALAATAAVVSFLTFYAARAGKISERASHIAFVPTGLLGVANVYGHVALSGDMLQMTNAVLALLVFSFVTLLPMVFYALTALSVALYVQCLIALGGDQTAHFAFMLVPGLLLGLLCFTQRYRTLTHLERLRITDKAKTDQLELMNQQIMGQVEEAERAAAEAKRANEAKGIFLANTSHELRTPLTGVLGTMNLLEHTNLDDEQRELVGAAQVSAKTLLTLINDILDLARLDEGKLALTAQAFEVGELVRHIAGLMRSAAEEKGLSLTCHFGDAMDYRLVGDPVRIGQILLNLIGNAIKFTEDGRVDITTSIDARDSNLYRLTLLVEDTGIGFSKEEGARLFQRFEQMDSSARRKQGGAGLGLSICRELAVLMDGTLDADSMPGVGSRFRFAVTLPKAEGKYDPTPKVMDHTETLQRLKLKVLLAEDNKVNQMLIVKLLERYGWEIIVASNGEEALQCILADRYDLVLMDVRMPVKDGVTAVREVRAAGGDRGAVPIIALTANTMAEDIESYQAVGMNMVVGKPIQIPEFEAAVMTLFRDRVPDAAE
ncbi:ATP-binding protein [Kordiimonas aestuarii]|uniref:ATP-binding protein n=1 Tax=Kordiimonas aestuarii TaxID=1005925 RepID=UPI0021D3C3AF|nr:ATP-binding protein [Kordiimonas aestuarii]